MGLIKEPCRVGTLSTSGIIFLGNGSPTLKAHATGPLCGPVSGSPSSRPGPPPCAYPVEVFWSSLARPMLTRHGEGRRVSARIPHPDNRPHQGSYPAQLPALGWEEHVPWKGSERVGCLSTPRRDEVREVGIRASAPSGRRNRARR